MRRLFVWLAAIVIILICSITAAHSQQTDLVSEARKTFIRITVQSPLFQAGHTDMGSGVLLSYAGHILTAGHVVASALDEGSLGDIVNPFPSSVIYVQFLDNNARVESFRYEASVKYYSPVDKSDIALLKIDAPAYILQPKPIPFLDPVVASDNCTACFVVLGFTDRGFESSPASPGQAIGSHYKRLLFSNMTYGYSGGPVYRRSLDSWSLVGIAVSGDKVRQATNFIVTLHAIEDALAPVRDSFNFNFRERPEFPSLRFKDWAGIDVSLASDGQIRSFVEQKLKVGPKEFVRYVLNEDFLNITENVKLANTAKLMVEHALALMYERKGSFDANLFTLLVEKVVTLYDLLGLDGYPSVARWREDAVVQQANCDQLSKGSNTVQASRCWQRLDWKQHELMVRAIKKGFVGVLGQYRQRRLPASSVIQWSIARVTQLLEWGDFLSRIGSQVPVPTLKQVRNTFDPTFLDVTRIPPRMDNGSPRIAYRAAALDKYDDAREVFSIVERDLQLKKTFSTASDLKGKLCARIKLEMSVLRDLFRDSPYRVDLENRLRNEIDPFCGL